MGFRDQELWTETLWIVVSRSCNFDCSYCYQGSHAKIPPKLSKRMPPATLEAAIPWATQWAKKGLSVNWYGGEPLLERDLIVRYTPILAKAFKEAGKAISFNITTNGSLLDAELRDFFDEYGISVLLSIDGPKRLHDRTRTYYGGRGTFDDIPLSELLQWRPSLEIAWQLDPSIPFEPSDLDEMIGIGVKNVNFNLNWLSTWDVEAQDRLRRFFKYAGRLMLQGKIGSNWKDKLTRSLSVDAKMIQPCGTGLHMLALTPEGYLYPSQEMAFTVFEPGRAPGTPEYYRVGDVRKDPVIDTEVLSTISKIKTSEMKPPPPYDCEDCVAKSVSIAGCHCRYVGQRPDDPSYRYDAPLGYCQSMVSAMTGLLMAASIERYVRPEGFKAPATSCGSGCACGDERQKPVAIELGDNAALGRPMEIQDIDGSIRALSAKVDRIEKRFSELPIVVVENVETE